MIEMSLLKTTCMCEYRFVYTVKPKKIQTPDVIFDIFLLVGAGHYSSFM